MPEGDNVTTIHHGDCIEVMNQMPPESVDAIVTDPPYGLGFMGKKWDGLPPSLEWAEACYRVLKPGGHIASFGGTRTWHRLAVAIEDAGFEMRDSLAWLYGSGFPKSHNVGKSTGDERYAGHGTALKPAFEPIVLARKPLVGTVARNVLAYGTGAINVDATRIALDGDYKSKPNGRPSLTGLGDNYDAASANKPDTIGRWPANVLLDQHAAAWVDEQSGVLKTGGGDRRSNSREIYGRGFSGDEPERVFGANSGGASRFFYSAKAPKSERPNVDGVQHPTVKPLAIMRWLIRLVTPPGGTVLDPFAGSGTTIEAALIEGFDPVGIEMEADYLPLIQHRIDRQAAHAVERHATLWERVDDA